MSTVWGGRVALLNVIFSSSFLNLLSIYLINGKNNVYPNIRLVNSLSEFVISFPYSSYRPVSRKMRTIAP